MNLAAGLLAFAALAACSAPPRVHHVGPVTHVALSARGRLLSCSQAGVLSGEPGDHVPLLPGGPRPFALATELDPRAGEAVLVAAGRPAREGRVTLLDLATGAYTEQRVADDVVYSVALNLRHGRAIAGCADGRVLLLPIADGCLQPPDPRLLFRHGGACRAVCLAADGSAVASAGRDGRVVLLEPGSGAVTECLGHTAGVECATFLPDGTLATGARDGRVRVHDRTGRLLRTWHRLGAAVLAITPSPVGLIAGTENGRLLLLLADREQPVLLADPGQPVHALACTAETLWIGTQIGLTRLPIAELAAAALRP